MPSELLRLIFALMWIVTLQATAQTYDIKDKPAEQMIQQRQTWNTELANLFSQINENRDWYCHSEDLKCIEGALADSEQMYAGLTVLVNEWEPLFHQTSHILSLFADLELPSQAKNTLQQYQTYLYILQQVDPSKRDLIAYSLGKLGYLQNYNVAYKYEKELAAIANRQKQKLDKLRYMAIAQVNREKRLLNSL